LEEQVWEWYAEQEHDNLQGYLADIRKAMEADGKADEYARNEEGIKDLLYERNSIDPADELIDNSAVTNMFYSLDGGCSGGCTVPASPHGCPDSHCSPHNRG
jgi:hypothetical protein